jgi:hypothetical protein
MALTRMSSPKPALKAPTVRNFASAGFGLAVHGGRDCVRLISAWNNDASNMSDRRAYRPSRGRRSQVQDQPRRPGSRATRCELIVGCLFVGRKIHIPVVGNSFENSSQARPADALLA